MGHAGCSRRLSINWLPLPKQMANTSSQKLNVDENPATASRFNISSIPAMLIFKNRQLVDTVVGLQPKQSISQRLMQASAR